MKEQCEHSNIEWDTTKEYEYGESKAYYGVCNDCGQKTIELWDSAGIWTRNDDDEPQTEI